MSNAPRVVVLASILFSLTACGGGSSGGGESGTQPVPPPNYSVGTSVTGSGSGTISPSSRNVSQGSTTTFTIAPATGSSIASVSGCGGSLNGTTYTTGAITSNCTVTATFDINIITVTATAGLGGSISPSSRSVIHGQTTIFSVTPNSGQEIQSVTGCAGTLSGNTYTTGPITAACTVAATFVLNTYTVTATAGEGGAITPNSVNVARGAIATFTVTPNTGFTTVLVEGCEGVLAGNVYRTGPINAPCAVSASFQAARGIALSVTGVPLGSPKLVAVVDLANGSEAIRQSFSHFGSGEASTVIGVPAGAGYRVRVIALGGSGTFPSVLAGGRQEGVTVTDDIASAVDIALTPPTWTLNPSTPTQVATSSTFNIVMEIEDPADFFSGSSRGRLWWSDQPLTANVSAIQDTGSLQQIAPGRYQFSISLTAPSMPGTIYYQFGENSPPFNDPRGSEAPFLILPDLNAGQSPLQIEVGP